MIEFNELTPALLERFIKQGALPNFERFYNASIVFTTHTNEQLLDPWVQWPTVHSGVPYEMHGVAHMGDGGI
ncbi:MAG: hypothetical protein JO018_05880, partial [Candidatus Eremiobacteraeota bacterium]|nr:hypothetical protein [Candidatus Eremiobacteraeota bacterium]